MLNAELPKDQKNLVVSPMPFEIVLAEDRVAPLSLIMPPLDDLAEIAGLEGKNFSLKEVSENSKLEISDFLNSELQSLKRKIERFSNSATFWNRLANISEMIGDRESEAQYLESALRVSSERFFVHKRGRNLIARNMNVEAERLFEGLELENDVYANLRLAAFHVQHLDLQKAVHRVAEAIKIDPLDFGARLFEGALRLVLGRYEEAIHSFRMAADERPTSSAVHCNLAIAYIRMKLPEKALSSLRRAVALNPLNFNAVTLLADIAFAEKRNEDAVPSLRYFLQFEQKNPSIWARLARALLGIGKFDEAIAALKRQSSLEQTSATWNNLGVAYHRNRDFKKALESFSYAMELCKDSYDRNYFLAARNIASLLSETEQFPELLRFTRKMIALDVHGLLLPDRNLSGLIALHVFALNKCEDRAIATGVAENILMTKGISRNLAAWLAVGLLANYSLQSGESANTLRIARDCLVLIEELESEDQVLKEKLINNVAFAFAELGYIADAEHYLSLISNKIHKDPYPTATLGLLHLRKGNSDRGFLLYEEAVSIAADFADKARIRQKLNVELGKYWLVLDEGKATRYLNKVIGEKGGEKILELQAKQLLKSLRIRP